MPPISLIKTDDFFHDFREAAQLRLPHNDITVYNAVQKISYVGVILAAILMVLSGLAIWKPVQFHTLTWLFFGFQGARLVHFLGMSAIVLFLAVHITLSLLVPKTLVAMTKGTVRVRSRETPPMRTGGQS